MSVNHSVPTLHLNTVTSQTREISGRDATIWAPESEAIKSETNLTEEVAPGQKWNVLPSSISTWSSAHTFRRGLSIWSHRCWPVHWHRHRAHNLSAPYALPSQRKWAVSLSKPAHHRGSSRGGAERGEGPQHSMTPTNMQEMERWVVQTYFGLSINNSVSLCVTINLYSYKYLQCVEFHMCPDTARYTSIVSCYVT